MAQDTTAGGPTSTAETRDFEKRNTDPTIPFDGSLPENIAGPVSNVELQIAANKRAAAHERGLSEGAARLRPEHAKQAEETGDAVTDSDVLVNPAAGLNVGEDAGADDRKRAAEQGVTDPNAAEQKPSATTDGDGKPVGRASRSERQTRA
jgi:hypothetical protein